MNRMSVLFGILLASFSLSAQADLRYDYLHLDYGKTDFDNAVGDGNSIGFGGSFSLNQDFFLLGSYTTTDLPAGVGASTLQIGAGYHAPMSSSVDVVAKVSYLSTEFDLPSNFIANSVDNDGFGVGVGIRVEASELLEIYGGLEYVDLDSGNDTGFEAGILYSINENIALGVGGDWVDNASSLTGMLRWYFDK